MEQYNNSAKIYTGSNGGELRVSMSNSPQIISATNNKAKYYSEQAKKYSDKAREYRDDALAYLEQNSDVTQESLDIMRADLQSQIDSKQACGDYALKEELPINVSELENDSNYVNQEELSVSINDYGLPLKEGHEGEFLYTDGEIASWKKLAGVFGLFDTKITDSVLTYEETLGWALQGTYVYKEAIAGSRYGYPDFYARCLAEYNEASTTETVNGITVKVHSNGHKFYDIANKTAIDNFYYTTGIAWFYGIDVANERIFLPRNDYLTSYVANEKYPVIGNGMALGLTDGTNLIGLRGGDSGAAMYFTKSTAAYGTNFGTTVQAVNNVSVGVSIGVTGDSGKSGINVSIRNKQHNLYLYICVGNAVYDTSWVTTLGQEGELVDQIYQKVNIDGTNLNQEGKSLLSGFSMPSNRSMNLTIGASGSLYVAPANGWFILNCQTQDTATTSNRYVALDNYSTGMTDMKWFTNATNLEYSGFVPAKKGETIALVYSGSLALNSWGTGFKFIYAEGDQ